MFSLNSLNSLTLEFHTFLVNQHDIRYESVENSRCGLTLFRPATFLPPKTKYMVFILDVSGFQKCIYEPY